MTVLTILYIIIIIKEGARTSVLAHLLRFHCASFHSIYQRGSEVGLLEYLDALYRRTSRGAYAIFENIGMKARLQVRLG